MVDESHDQDTTDLHKCVAYVCDWAQNLDKSNVSYTLSVSSALEFTLSLHRSWKCCWPIILILMFAKLAASMFLIFLR